MAKQNPFFPPVEDKFKPPQPPGFSKLPPPKVPTPPGIIRNGDTGNISGITLDDGTTLLGLNPAQVEQLAQSRLRATKGGAATREFEGEAVKKQEQVQQEQLMQQNQQLANQVLSPTATTAPQATDLSQKQAGFAAVREGLPGVVKSVGIGAAIGAGAGAPVAGVGAVPGAVIGAGIGLALGVYNAVVGSLESQASDSIAGQTKVLRDGKNNLNKIIALTKADPQNADKYLSAYQQQKIQINEAYANLKLDTSRSSFKFLSKVGTRALQGYANFYSQGGLNEIYDNKMQLAILGQGADPTDLMAFAGDVE